MLKACQLPVDPHGQYKILHNAGQFVAENYVNEFTVVDLSCDLSYKRMPLGQQYSICGNGFWNPAYSCERTCPTLLPTASTIIRCYFNDVLLESCESPLDGTIAEFDCQPYYENFNSVNSFVRCENGDWIGMMHECSPICGEKGSVGRTNIINGTNALKGSYPWHVGIYKNNEEFICGGSIISPRLILTAAHCLTNNADGTPYPKEDYLVAAGKYYRSYNDPRDVGAQYPIIQSIHIPTKYKGDKLHHETDLAVMVLSQNLVISDKVQPICIDWFKRYEAQQLILNNLGTVTGWGYTMEGQHLSDELKELSVPYIPFDQCFRIIAQNFTKYVRPDKICGGYVDLGTSVCGGDSGGALAFPLLSNGKYYIRGIVSVSPATEYLECNSHQYGLYTSLSNYLTFVRPLMYTSTINESFIKNTNTPLPSSVSSPLPSPLPSLMHILVHDNEGSSCTTPNNEEGTCMTATSCPNIASAITDAINRKDVAAMNTKDAAAIDFAKKWLCGYYNGEDLVCCTSTGISSPSNNTVKRSPIYEHPLLPNSSVCGIQQSTFKTIDFEGHIETDFGEFPWVALILYNASAVEVYECGGSLISKRYVITDSFCTRFYLKAIGVRLGEHDKRNNPDCRNKTCADPVLDIGIEEVKYRYGFHPFGESDRTREYLAVITLIRLDRDVSFTNYIRPICLSSGELDLPVSTKLNMAGFGRFGQTNLGSTLSKVKRKLLLLVKDAAECTSIINSNEFCAGSEKNILRCNDGTGGPAMRIVPNSNPQQWMQEGVVLHTFFQCGKRLASANENLRVSRNFDWIISNMRK